MTTEKDSGLDRIDAEISRLKSEREERLKELENPKRAEIRAQYEIIRLALAKLDELGESTHDGECYAVTVWGNTFRLSGSEPVEEV